MLALRSEHLYSEHVFGSAFTRRQPHPWERPVGLEAVLEQWRSNPRLSPCFVLDETLPGSAGELASLPEALSPAVRFALKRRGVERLFSHQAQAFELARAGHDIVVATPTASGKSLCYHLPVLDRLSSRPEARALYLFPTKALARDQESSLCGLLRDSGLEHGAVTYDGDTPADARRAARDRGGIVITNPDMLHAGILPHHAAWARFLASVAFVVIDELHVYRGVFGSHLSNVLRRLLRVLAFHGARPVFLFCSATIGNPAEHATSLLGRPVRPVEHSGAPSGRRRVLLYNPPVVNRELGIRASYVKSAVRLAGDLLRADVATMVFGQSRNTVEVMLKYLRERAAADGIDPERVQAYRGGYLSDTRRRIETGLREGEIRAVVATNALELGIDVGALDAVVCAAYPGTLAALWQRFGRAGRRRSDSLALLVASSAPLDQYVALAPRMLVDKPIERARIDPDNVEILLQHLKCAAFELPFASTDSFGDVPQGALAQALEFLGQHDVLQPVPDPSGAERAVYHWASDTYPAHHVSLRSASWDNFAIIELEGDGGRGVRTIAEMDFRSTHTMLHEQAIYQHDGEQFQVERLDFENHKAYVRRVDPDYFTTAMTTTRVNVLHEDALASIRFSASAPSLTAGLGEVNVVEKVVGYKKIKFHTHENVGYGEVQLPEMQMPTSALWVVVPEAAVGAVLRPRPVVIDALRGIAHAMHTVAAVGLMMDPHDLGCTLQDGGDRGGVGLTSVVRPPPSDAPSGGAGGVGACPQRSFEPTVFLFDRVAGGIGLAPRLFEERETLLVRARAAIAGCECESGCPACVGPEPPEPAAGGAGADDGGRKRVALALMDVLGCA